MPQASSDEDGDESLGSMKFKEIIIQLGDY